MATENYSMKRRNNDDDLANNSAKKQAIELSTFKKYSVLVPELRKPITDYSPLSTLKNYAECSKLCSSEVRSLKNTIGPETLRLFGTNDEVTVILAYKTGPIEKSFQHGPTMTSDVEEYVMKTYRGVNRGRTEEISVDMTEWPMRIMQIKQLTYADRCHITLNKSIMTNFLEFAKSTKLKLNLLHFIKSGEEPADIILPREFFKTNFMKNVSQFITCVQFQASPDDLVNSSCEYIHMKDWMDPHLIQETILKHNAVMSHKKLFLRVILRSDDNREHDYDVIIPADRFPDRQFQQFCYQIGSVSVAISRRKILEVRFEPHQEE